MSRINIKHILLTYLLSLALLPGHAIAESEATSSGGTVALVVVGVFMVLVILFYVVIFAFSIFMFVFWIIMLVDVIQRTNWSNDNDKTTWTLVVALTGGIGAIVYYFMVRRKLGPARDKTANVQIKK